MAGYSLAHAIMMMIPEAWEQHTLMDPTRRAFYEYHAAMMEPWDGPAAIAFTDGRQIGATLDRNGLRPARYIVTDDDLVVMASEAGVLPDIPESRIIKKWRLQPGKMFLIDLEQGRIIDDKELKDQLAAAKPYRQWIEHIRIKLDEVAADEADIAGEPESDEPLLDRQQAFGYTQEDLKFLMAPMMITGEEAVGSMGTDTPLAVLSDHTKPLYHYFKQLFAQVTNPPIDPIREQMVMSLVSFIGPKPNLLDINNINPPLRLEADQPILTAEDMAKIRHIERYTHGKFKSFELHITYPVAWGKEGIEARHRVAVRARGRCDQLGLQHPDRHRSADEPRQRRHPGAARDVGHPPAPDREGPAHQCRPGGRDRLGARGPSFRGAGRLRRRGDPSVPGDGDHRVDAPPARWRSVAREGDQELHQGDRQGPAEGHVEDGHLHLHVLHRRADLRGHRPEPRAGGPLLHRHRLQHRRPR